MAEAAPLEDLVQCSICLGRLVHAKMLPCQHTFCLQCLYDLVPEDVRAFNCPTCRRRIQIPKIGIQGFKDNLLVNNLLDMVGEQAECLECGRERVLKRCSGHCDLKLCKDCCSAHRRLKEEIEEKFGLMRKRVSEKSAAAGRKIFDAYPVSIEFKVHEAFDKAINILVERREKLKKQVRETVKFQKMLSVNSADNEFLRDGIKSCDSVQKLTEMKDWFATLDTEKEFVDALAEGSEQEFRFDLPAVENFGRIDCGGVEFGQLRNKAQSSANEENTTSTEEEKAKKTDSTTSTEEEKAKTTDTTKTKSDLGNKATLPKNIDYKSKRFALRQKCPVTELSALAETQKNTADSGRSLVFQRSLRERDAVPDSIVHSIVTNSLYCVSAGLVMEYDFTKLIARCVYANKERMEIIEIAATKSGKLLLMDGRSVKYFDLKDPEIPASESKSLLVGLSYPIQICSWGKEFAVLDFGRKCLNVFTEGGRMVREIKVPDVRRESKMCLDNDGNIHISTFQAEKSTLERFVLDWSMYVFVVSWNGESRGRLLLDRGQINYRSYTGTESDIQTMIINNALRNFGVICIDGDGKIAVTRPKDRCIEIYHPKMVANRSPEMDEIVMERAYYRVFREALTTFGVIKQQESPLEKETSITGFDRPNSICWTPDGKLICCDESGILTI